MGKYIATTKCTVSISPYVASSQSIVCQKGYKIDGSECYIGSMSVVLAGVSDPSGNVCAAMTITIKGSSQKNKSKGLPVILEKDNGQSSGTFTNSSGATVTETVTATIINAGQTKVKAE